MPNPDAHRIEVTFLSRVSYALANDLLEAWGRTYSGILDWSIPRLDWGRRKPTEQQKLDSVRDGSYHCVVEVSKHAQLNWLLTQLQAQPDVDASETYLLPKSSDTRY